MVTPRIDLEELSRIAAEQQNADLTILRAMQVALEAAQIAQRQVHLLLNGLFALLVADLVMLFALILEAQR